MTWIGVFFLLKLIRLTTNQGAGEYAKPRMWQNLIEYWLIALTIVN